MKNFVFIGLVGFFALIFLSFADTTSAQIFRVTICHATASSTNPYNKITVSPSAINGVGNSDHNRDGHQNGEDIIPPGFWDFDGRNWDSAGQAIYNNDCNPVTSPTPTPTDEPTPTPTDEPSPTPTEVPSPTPTDNPEPTPTPTEVPSPTPTDEPTPTPKPGNHGNRCEINNNVNADSSTGGNIINRITNGLSRIFTGDSRTNIRISNECYFNYTQLDLSSSGYDISIDSNGSSSKNIIRVNKVKSIHISQ